MLSKKRELSIPILTFLPSITTDQMLVGGGNPAVTQPPAPVPAVPQPQTLPPPVELVTPPKAKPAIQAEVEPVAPSKKLKSEPEPVAAKPPSKDALEIAKTRKKETPKAEQNSSNQEKADVWKPSFTLANRSKTARTKESTAKARANAAAQAEAARRAFAAKVRESLRTLGSSFAPGTSIEVPGPGGALFANYKLVVEAMYQRAWITPEEINEESAVARAKVVIRRDGTVVEARMVKPSGIRAMDKSVERALELKFIAPFPEDSKDSERLFYINFDLKTKRLL
jgi:outer membrane biosynthesis protein TonB